ncbi:MAG: hypothetical protein R8G01_23250 [Ilumatobacteraceae bacterium]|nr:hypothetical protein [Ilumatobacteraceae bacterium]
MDEAPTTTGPVGSTSPTTAPDPGSSTSSMVTVASTPDDTTATTQPDEFDWVAIVQGLYDTLADINTSPAIDRVSEFCVAVESPCRDRQGAQIETLVRDGWRVVDPVPIPVVSAEFDSTADGREPIDSTLVVLNVVVGPRDGVVGTIIDANGDVLFEVDDETTEPTPVTWFVRFEPDVGWRVFETRGID